jgi:hypothetical protein
LLWILSTTAREMVSISEQVIRKRHALRPGFFSQRCLFGMASEIMVWENAKRGEIEMFSKPPYYIGCNYSETICGGLVGKDHPEENGPLTAPILSNLVPNMSHVRSKLSLDGPDFCLNLRLLRDGGGHDHYPFPSSAYRIAQSETVRRLFAGFGGVEVGAVEVVEHQSAYAGLRVHHETFG